MQHQKAMPIIWYSTTICRGVAAGADRGAVAHSIFGDLVEKFYDSIPSFLSMYTQCAQGGSDLQDF